MEQQNWTYVNMRDREVILMVGIQGEGYRANLRYVRVPARNTKVFAAQADEKVGVYESLEGGPKLPIDKGPVWKFCTTTAEEEIA